tara:strand:- start:730 stop:1071 length:342 start_codon:yes stop_codon:yes gene_type:complete
MTKPTSQCTCASDKEITCIVHPTTHSLKEYIAYLEEQLELCVTTEYHDSIVAEAMQRLADSDRAVVVLSKRIEYLEEQVELERSETAIVVSHFKICEERLTEFEASKEEQDND